MADPPEVPAQTGIDIERTPDEQHEIDLVEIRPLTVDEFYNRDGHKLFAGHAEEAEPAWADRLFVDPERYAAAEAAETLILLGAVNAWGKVIGYAVAEVYDHPHYDMRVARADAVYLKPDWRRAGIGVRLIKALFKARRDAGAECLFMHAKLGTDLMRLLERLGLEPEEVIFKEAACP